VAGTAKKAFALVPLTRQSSEFGTSFRRRPPICIAAPRSVGASCTFEVSGTEPPFQIQAKMSDNEYAIESTDAGASETIPMEAGQIKKGG